jgi:hypothetical protein
MDLAGSIGCFAIGLFTGAMNGRWVENDINRSTAVENNHGGTYGMTPLTVGVLGPVILELIARRPESLAFLIGHEIALLSSVIIRNRRNIEA